MIHNTRVHTNIRCCWLYSVRGRMKSIINRGTPVIPFSRQNMRPWNGEPDGGCVCTALGALGT